MVVKAMSLPVFVSLRTDKIKGDRRFGGPVLTISIDDGELSITDTSRVDRVPMVLMQAIVALGVHRFPDEQARRWKLYTKEARLTNTEKAKTRVEFEWFIQSEISLVSYSHKHKEPSPNIIEEGKPGDRVTVMLSGKKESILEGTIREAEFIAQPAPRKVLSPV